jgi:DnaJ like chaperone protein
MEPAPEPRKPPPPREEPIDTRGISSFLEAYELLGLPLNATVEEIRRRYRDLARACHPDRVSGLDPEIQELADRKFRALREAYERIMSRSGPPGPSDSRS